MSSWVKVSRKLLTSAIASKPEYLAIWVHLLLSASYKPGEVLVGHQVVKLEAGQLVFGRLKFSQQIGVSEHTLRMALKALESLQQITIKSYSKFSVISVVNWEKYQSESPANHQQTTSNQPASHHNKEIQEIQEIQEEKPCGQPADSRGQINGSGLSYTAIQDAYNRICVPTLPACRSLSDKRKRLIKALVNVEIDGIRPFREHGLPFVEAYFVDCLKNPHWVGNNDRGWKADFDFLVKADNAIKVLEKNL